MAQMVATMVNKGVVAMKLEAVDGTAMGSSVGTTIGVETGFVSLIGVDVGTVDGDSVGGSIGAKGTV